MRTSIVLLHHLSGKTHVKKVVQRTTNPGMFYCTSLCNQVLMNGCLSISNSYTLCNVYVQSTTNPSMFYDTTVITTIWINTAFCALYHDENTRFSKNYLTMMPIEFFDYKFIIVSYTTWSWFGKSFVKPESLNNEIFFSYWWVLPSSF